MIRRIRTRVARILYLAAWKIDPGDMYEIQVGWLESCEQRVLDLAIGSWRVMVPVDDEDAAALVEVLTMEEWELRGTQKLD